MKEEWTNVQKDEKVDVKALQEKLTVDRKNGAAKLDASVIKKADKFCEGYKDFLAHAKTEREAVTEAIRIAEEAGFVPYDPMATYKAGDRVYVNNRGKAIMLAVIGTKAPARACTLLRPISTTRAST